MKSYNGTLFRFALRTHKQAEKSDICKTYYDKKKVMDLLKCLHDSGPHLMLYTQNIKHISVSHISETGTATDIEKWFSFDKEIARVIRDIGGKVDDLGFTEAVDHFTEGNLCFERFQRTKTGPYPCIRIHTEF